MSFGARIRPSIHSHETSGTFRPVLNKDNQYLSEEEMKLFGDQSSYVKSMMIGTFQINHNCNFGYLRDLQKEIHSNGISASIAGGSVMSAIIGEPSKAADIDVFPHSWTDFLGFIKWFVDDRGWYSMADTDREFLRKDPSSVKFIQLRPTNKTVHQDSRPIQLIKMAWMNDTQEVLMAFDLRCVMFGIQHGSVFYTEEALSDLKARRLTINNTIFPIGLCKRIRKYCERGFSMIDGTVDDMIEVLGGSNLVSSAVVSQLEQKVVDTGLANWDNPQYRDDYYQLESNQFRKKWEGVAK